MSIGQAEIYNDILSRRGGGRAAPNPEVPHQLADKAPLSSKIKPAQFLCNPYWVDRNIW